MIGLVRPKSVSHIWQIPFKLKFNLNILYFINFCVVDLWQLPKTVSITLSSSSVTTLKWSLMNSTRHAFIKNTCNMKAYIFKIITFKWLLKLKLTEVIVVVVKLNKIQEMLWKCIMLLFSFYALSIVAHILQCCILYKR